MSETKKPLTPIILHEQEGLRIVKNAKNAFCVVTLHYTADPRKRTPEWKEEAKAGMHPAKFAQEYEIDYTAMYGEKVFPEITTLRDKIIVKEPFPDFPDTQVYWGGFDYGARNPSSFHVYTIWDGCVYSVWELFEPCRNVPEFAQKLRECPYWDKIKYIAADPSIWWNTQQSKVGNLVSVCDLFFENKITKLIKGVHDEAAWLAIMRAHWQNAEDPTFRIFDCCTNQIREFETAVYVSTSDRMLQTQNFREAINDHNNHTLDDCKYFMNSRPKISKSNIKTPRMVSRWLN